MIRYCPTCDRSTEDARFIGEFCEFCMIKLISKEVPESIALSECKVCGKIKGINEFLASEQKAMSEILQREIKNKEIRVSSVHPSGSHAAIARFNYMAGKDELVFEKKIMIKRHMVTCTKCSRQNSGYYQAIVQIRGERSAVSRMSDKITRFIEKRDSFIAKRLDLRNGIDLYVEDRKKMSSFFDLYKEHRPKKSYTLAGMKNGKKLYRVTFSLNLDVVKSED
jgi:NMD protein affecting ribosome stability and mRNA decay